MPWHKLGRIHCLEPAPHRATTHMQVPAPVLLGSRIRVYFAARDMRGMSYPAYLDVDARDPTRVLAVHDAPVMRHGPPGTFDDEGIMPACALHQGGVLWLYYSGWNQRRTIPYHNTTGVAVSRDGGAWFERMFDGPILERTPHEPYIAVTPWVMQCGDIWQMWYVSGTTWKRVNDKFEPVYAIKYADSMDGIHWRRPNVLAVPQRHPDEACAHPSVIARDGRYHMWFCYRDTVDFRDGRGSYRIGYARSSDGVRWERDDASSGIEVGSEGWDAKMICYPSVLEADGRLLMFHNGNSFGQSGIGCAVWEGPLP
jgi:hypothetical protein